jgi:hypothetical protein
MKKPPHPEGKWERRLRLESSGLQVRLQCAWRSARTREGAMIKATFDKDGRTVLLLGLSFKNLDKFRAEPRDTIIRIDGREMDLPIDVMIISGETEAHMQELLEGGIGPHTKGTFDPKLRS